MRMRALLLLVLVFSVVSPSSLPADASWTRPFPPHQIADNLYYVGTEDLACFLLTGSAGHILINTGLADSVPLIRASIEKHGFQLKDVKILLTTQAHFDHVAAMKEMQSLTGAQMYATERDAAVLEDGGKSDPFFFDSKYQFAPVKVGRRLRHGDTVELGDVKLRVISTPGHSIGSVSYATTVTQGGKSLRVLIANMNSVVMPLLGNRKYPEIVEDLRTSFERQKALQCDIWVAGHASQYDMARKWKSGSFIDPDGYRKAVLRYEQLFEEALARERAAAENGPSRPARSQTK